ncbi:MAG TPA: peptide ABC transporter substrate-binding protein [Gammaproteobacteria bacterium]|nr:periplasmic oligopeptide-binding protein precursor [bacterium BMS3Abin11]GMT39344.1 MAG: peptide ABC transporter substrate-binding protein [bacterium]HDH17039.1 peptide ABC transporter substrate-binding protein [Gammaproteobacteria bacterium]HDZ79364.1 peptide ABC transporter substrate-binding protein [Gammaproteobacteria bacterium]
MLKRLFLSLCLLAVSQATFAKPDNLAAEQVLRRGNGSEVQTLDPHKAEGVPASNILRDLYEGLTIEKPDGTVIPGAAESWEISDDGKVYTFKMRKNARWSNGDPVTAGDFVYGLRRSVDPATGSQYSQILAPILNAEAIIAGKKPVDSLGVEAIDDSTLKITLKAATPYLLGLLNHSTTYPVHKGSVEKNGDKFSRPGKLVGNGAYVLKEWVVQSHVVLERNPMYWDNDNTIIEKVIYLPIEESSAELKRYRAGEVDITGSIPTSQYNWIKKNLPGELHIAPTLGTYYYGFNLTRPPFKDNLKLRKALSMAVDREILTEKITKAGEIPAYGWVPPGVNNYTSQQLDYAELSGAERIKKAKQLYREAGYSKGNPLTVEIRYNTSEGHKKVAIAISAMWKMNLGVKTKLINEEWKVFLQNRKQKKLTQVFRGGWIGDYNDAFTFAELMQSNHGINDSGYNNPEYDKLLEQAATESDMKKRRSILEAAERMLLKDHAIMPLYFYVSKHLIKPYVKGYEPNILDHTYTKNLWIVKH